MPACSFLILFFVVSLFPWVLPRFRLLSLSNVSFDWFFFVTIFIFVRVHFFRVSLNGLNWGYYLRKRNCMHCKRLQSTMPIHRNTICMNQLTWSKPIQQWMLRSFRHRNVPKLLNLMYARWLPANFLDSPAPLLCKRRKERIRFDGIKKDICQRKKKKKTSAVMTKIEGTWI